MQGPQEQFDHLVSTAEAWLTAPAFSADERALEQVLEEARARDPGVAEAAVDVAFERLAKGLSPQ